MPVATIEIERVCFDRIVFGPPKWLGFIVANLV